jgi:N4-gp56 family major capsid protein
MAQTVIGLNSPQAVKLWSASLFVDISKSSYFTRKMMGTGDTLPIQLKTDLESDDGDEVKYDISVAVNGVPVEGDAAREGSESNLKFFQDYVRIDQMYKGVNAGGKMSRKRTLHNLRTIARARLREYWARLFDEMIFIYLSGARGINPDFVWPLGWTGRANNAIQAPDSSHIMYGDGSSKATLTSGGKMSRAVVERAVTKATTMGGGSAQNALTKLQPSNIEGTGRYCMLMHTYQEHDMRTTSTTGDWLDIQKAAAGAEGRSNPIFGEALGMLRGTILHSHESVVRFNDYGAGNNVAAARALFLGRQAGVLAFGSPGEGLRFQWHEEMENRGNDLIIGADVIVGCKKSRFNGYDYGVISIDTAAADPA